MIVVIATAVLRRVVGTLIARMVMRAMSVVARWGAVARLWTVSSMRVVSVLTAMTVSVIVVMCVSVVTVVKMRQDAGLRRNMIVHWRRSVVKQNTQE